MEKRIFLSLNESDRYRASISPETRFVAAANAIAAMLYYSPERYLPRLRNVDLAGFEFSDARILTFGHWELVPNRGSLTPQIAALPERNRWHDDLRAHFLSDNQEAMRELEALWTTLLSQVIYPEADRRQEILAAGINAWHQTLDPHARLLPTAYLSDYLETKTPPTFAERLKSLEAGVLPSAMPVRATYIKLKDFHQMSGAVRTTVRDLEPKSEAYILDLRGNSGSYFDDARQILDTFLDPTATKRQFYVTKPRETLERENFVSQRAADTRKPIVVLIDATTKSAAELVAGVFQQFQRAWLVGDTSFGKGTYVNVTERFGGDVLLRESTHVLHYANGGSPQLVGVTPDFFVSSNPGADRVINLYSDPLPREAPHFIQFRESEVQKLTKCMDEIERGNRRVAADLRMRKYEGDYPVVRALLLLQCQIHGAPPR